MKRGFSSAVAVLLGVCFWLAEPVAAQMPAPNSARIIALTGNLSVNRTSQQTRILRLNDWVLPGDELVTGQNSEATIQASDGSTVHIFPDSRVIFSQQSPGIGDFLHLFFGSIKVHIEKLSGRPNPQRLTTPTAVIAVRGTTFSVFVDETDTTLVAVDEGTVAVSNVRLPGRVVILRGGQRTRVRPGQPPTRAQRFRGRSERADMTPDRGANRMGEGNSMMSGQQESMPGPSGGRGMGGRGGPRR